MEYRFHFGCWGFDFLSLCLLLAASELDRADYEAQIPGQVPKYLLTSVSCEEISTPKRTVILLQQSIG